MTLLALFVVLIFAYGLTSGRLERTIVTAPIVFTAAGMCTLFLLPELRNRHGDPQALLTIAEIGLVLLLFSDASRTDLKMLRSIRNLPVRLLSVGMLLTIVVGALAALAVLPGLSLWEAGILAAILAPTDAGLGQIIVSSSKVPMRIRQALNVEAGLNDGLSVPFMLFFIALAGETAQRGDARLWHFILAQLGLGAGIGLAIGLTGGWLLGVARRKRSMTHSFHRTALVTLPVLCAIASEALGASMFIAAFVAGLAVQAGFKEAGASSLEVTEEWGQLFNLFIIFLFGLLVARAWHGFTLAAIAYAVLSLTVVRMVPVALALARTGLSRATIVFMGWFGPRGLASIVLGLVYLESQARLPGEATISLTVMVTVLLSIFVHGLSASPGIDLYATRVAALGPGAPEHLGVGE
jgi:NhaP-type Na+/H+ or K+/H+ antiporter